MKRKIRIIDDLKKLHECIVDDNEQFLSIDQYLSKMRKSYPNFRVINRDREFEFLKGIMHLVMTTKITSINTKNYIKSHEGSVSDFVVNYNSTVDEDNQLKEGSVQASVQYDKNRLLKFFTNNVIDSVVYGFEPNIADYEKMLNNARVKYMANKKMLDNLVLNIRDNVACDTLPDEEFDELLGTLSIYTKEYIKYISKGLSDEQVGYLNYLVMAYNLKDEDLERYKRLKYILEGVEPDKDKKHEEYIDEHEVKKTRIQYDSSITSKDEDIEDESDIDLEDIDFGDITEADVE